MSTMKDIGLSYSAPGAVDLSAKVFYLGKIDASGNIALAAAATDRILGNILSGSSTVGKPATVQYGGGGKVILGGTVTAGDPLTSDANGKGVTASGSNIVVGVAVESGVAGDIIGFLHT